ncbi:MAG: amidohydrolase family protein [Bryobacteraceae bacterium]
MVIDFHSHFPKQDRFAERLVDLLPAAGIDTICLCSAGEEFGHAPNEEILAAAAKHPRQIVALALVRLGIDPPEVVTRYAAEGYRGFKITNPRAAYDTEAFFPVYERMEETGLPLLAHTGILMGVRVPRGVRVNSNWMRPICLDPVVRSFPGLNVVGAHMGVPWHEEASMMARMHRNFYLDLTGAHWGGWRVNKTPEFYRYHFFWPGAWDKVVFGTDILGLEELVPSRQYHDKMIESLDLPRETVEKIYGGTAARLLGLDANSAKEAIL